jgi:FkbM family methyltransferase
MFLNITKDFRKVLKSNIYLLGFVYELIYRFDIFLPIDPEYEIVKFINDKKQKNILDIGAHKGESIRSFRIFAQDTPILAFEANPVHREYLDKCKKKYKNIDYQFISASDHSGKDQINVPVYKGIELSAWASNSQEECLKIFMERAFLSDMQKNISFRTTETPAIDLDQFNLDPFLIKIDVEGTELKILKGLYQTLIKHFPILIIEKNNCEQLKAFLEPLSYKAYIYDYKNKLFIEYQGQDFLNLIFISDKFYAYDQLKQKIT